MHNEFSRQSSRARGAAVVAALVAATLVSAGPAYAQMTDRVVTRNGDEFTGEMKSLGSGRLSFKTRATETIPIYWDHVVELTSQFFFEVVLDDGRRLYGALLPPTEPGTVRIGTDAAASSIALGVVAKIERIRLGFWKRLKGSVDLSFSLNKANNRRDFSFALSTNYRTRQGAWRLSYDSLYRQQDATADLDRQDLSASYQRFLTGHWLVSGFAAGQRNTELALDLRLIVGAAGGYHLVRTIESDLIVLVGIDTAEEQFSDDRANTTSVEAFVGLNYNLYTLGGRDFIVTASATVFPSISVKGRVRTEISADIRKEIWKDFYIPLRGFFSSDNSVNHDDEQAASSDYGVTLGIGYTW